MPPSPLTTLQDWLGPLVGPLTTVGMVAILLIFMLMQREENRNRLIRLFGASNLHITTEVIKDVSQRISRYLLMQFLINACYGVLVALGLWVLGVPSAVTWGVMSFACGFCLTSGRGSRRQCRWQFRWPFRQAGLSHCS